MSGVGAAGAGARTALVLGGGGLAGIAWEVGVLVGLADAGVDVSRADLVVGTSAGSVVGALLSTGVPLEQVWAAQFEDAGSEVTVQIDGAQLTELFAAAIEGATSRRDALARIGAMALATPTVPAAERRAVIAARLPVHEWPQRRFLVVAVDAHSGELVVLDRASGIGLVDAVAASCAVPGVWPPVPVVLGGAATDLIDGGVRSATNGDLAVGAQRVLVLATAVGQDAGGGVMADRAALEPGSRVAVVAADEASTAASGTNALDPATRAPSARAGREQGRASADAVRRAWREQA